MLTFTLRSGTLIATVTGDIDQHTASSLREQIDLTISHENVRRLIFDFTKLDFMDSSGIGLIIGRYKIMTSVKGRVSIVAVKPTLRKLLDLSGIGRIVNIHDTLSDALKSA